MQLREGKVTKVTKYVVKWKYNTVNRIVTSMHNIYSFYLFQTTEIFVTLHVTLFNKIKLAQLKINYEPFFLFNNKFLIEKGGKCGKLMEN